MSFEERHAGDQRRHGVVLVHLGVQLARGVLARGRAADQRQKIDRVGEIAFDREAPRHVLEVRVEAAVLVDHQHHRPFALGLGAGEVAVDLAFGGIVGHALGHEPCVVVGDDRSLCVVVLQKRQKRRACRGRSRKLGEPVEERTARHAAVGEAVVEIDDALVEFLVHVALLVSAVSITRQRRRKFRGAGMRDWAWDFPLRGLDLRRVAPHTGGKMQRAG